MRYMATKAQIQVQEFLVSVGPDYQYLPHPRRWGLPSMLEFEKENFGSLMTLMEDFGKKQLGMNDLAERIVTPSFRQQISKEMSRGVDPSFLPYKYAEVRHRAVNAPIFTVSPSLSKMLADTGVKHDIPALYLAPPCKTAFIEFEPAEERKANLEKNPNPRYIEGCYIQETVVNGLHGPNYNEDFLEKMGLNKDEKTRLLDLVFPFTPMKDPARGASYLLDPCMMKQTIYIQNENESLIDIIKRQLHVTRDLQVAGGGDFIQANLNMELMQETLVRLSKTLLYLNLNIRDQVVEKPGKEFEARLRESGSKKRSKLERQAARVYDRIVIGPKEYIPLAERSADGSGEKGSKKPHFRRGYFGVRWTGSGEDKKPELVRIKECLIHKEKMVASALDYEIR